MNNCLVDIDDLTIGYFTQRKTLVHVLQNVSLQIKPGETLGLVGASGCGMFFTRQSNQPWDRDRSSEATAEYVKTMAANEEFARDIGLLRGPSPLGNPTQSVSDEAILAHASASLTEIREQNSFAPPARCPY